MKKDTRKGQMAIFVIIAIAIVVVIVIMVAVNRKAILNPQEITDPEKFIEKCARDATLEAVEKMMPQGGFVNPTNVKVYNDINISYLCQNMGNYLPCINQHPAFLNDEKEEIKKYILPRVEKCFEDFKSQSNERNEKVDYGELSLGVSLAPGKIFINIEKNTRITKNEEAISLDKYNSEIASPLYDLVNVAIEIGSNEAKYCYFEYAGYMILHPEVDIRVFTMSDSTRIYTIKDKNTGESMNIAIRGCAIPPGI
jgi:hypothetical protein